MIQPLFILPVIIRQWKWLYGQTSAHDPQSWQIQDLLHKFTSEIALTGHSSIQVPHAIHSSDILYAIILSLKI